jgi:hypothetical protein
VKETAVEQQHERDDHESSKDLLEGVLEKALAAVVLELRRITPIHEGLRDYNLVNIHEDTRVVVLHAIALYDERVALLEAARVALEALLGLVDLIPMNAEARAAVARLRYQPVKLPPVTQAVYDDLADNQHTITAAFGEFDVMNEARTLEIEWGTPEPPAV